MYHDQDEIQNRLNMETEEEEDDEEEIYQVSMLSEYKKNPLTHSLSSPTVTSSQAEHALTS